MKEKSSGVFEIQDRHIERYLNSVIDSLFSLLLMDVKERYSRFSSDKSPKRVDVGGSS